MHIDMLVTKPLVSWSNQFSMVSVWPRCANAHPASAKRRGRRHGCSSTTRTDVSCKRVCRQPGTCVHLSGSNTYINVQKILWRGSVSARVVSRCWRQATFARSSPPSILCPPRLLAEVHLLAGAKTDIQSADDGLLLQDTNWMQPAAGTASGEPRRAGLLHDSLTSRPPSWGTRQVSGFPRWWRSLWWSWPHSRMGLWFVLRVPS